MKSPRHNQVFRSSQSQRRRMSASLCCLAVFLAFAAASHAQFETKLTASDPGREDFFGEAVAISRDDVIVGVRTSDDGNRTNTGAAYVFKRIDGQWQEVQKLVASDRSAGDFFGESVAIDGDRILVSALGVGGRCPAGVNFNTCNFGAVYAFERIDGQWQQVQKLDPPNPVFVDPGGASSNSVGFGWEVALDGDRAVIGSPQDNQVDIQAGAAYFYVRENGEWVPEQKLLPRSGLFASFFGTTIGLDGDRLIVGSPTDDEAGDGAGAAHLFERPGNLWQRVAKLLPPPVTPPDSVEFDTFAREVALNGDWAFVGSGDDEQCIIDDMLINPDEPNSCTSGAVFAYQRQANGDWELQQKIAPEELEQFDLFGFLGIAVEGNRAVVGARGDDDACPNPLPPGADPNPLFCDPGAVYVFELMDGEWRKIDKLTASDANALDILGGAFFGQGRMVGISGQRVIAGAPTLGLSEVDPDHFGQAYVFDLLGPHVSGQGTVNGGSFMPDCLTPSMIATAFVRNAGADAIATVTPLPEALSGTSLEITDSAGVTRPSGLFGIFNGGRQINFLIDSATALGPATITLKRADGEMSTAAIQIDQVAPGVFFIGNAAGQFVALATVLTISGGNVTTTFTFAGDFSLEPIDLGGPADQVFLSLFVTGLRFASGVANMSATIDGEDVPVFSFVGELEQFLGLGQVNIGPIDRSFIGRGPVEVIFIADGKPSNPVMVSFK